MTCHAEHLAGSAKPPMLSSTQGAENIYSLLQLTRWDAGTVHHGRSVGYINITNNVSIQPNHWISNTIGRFPPCDEHESVSALFLSWLILLHSGLERSSRNPEVGCSILTLAHVEMLFLGVKLAHSMAAAVTSV